MRLTAGYAVALPRLFAVLIRSCSNGIRFSITSLAPPFTRLLRPVFAKRAAISLFDALTPSPKGLIFQKDTINSVAEALAGFHRLAVAHNVAPQHMFVFATEAMRRADNAGDMLAAISKATDGLGVQILEPSVETLFGAVMGSRSGVVGVPKGALFLDLGGGSVQMTWVDTSAKDYEIKAATAGSSMPYGAAKLMRILTEQPVEKRQVEISTLQSGMKTVYGVLCSQFPALNALKAAHERGEKAPIDVYMCGGGFRGYGSMLMYSDSISPYPISSVSTYTATGEQFKQTAKMKTLNISVDGKIYGMSRRRRQQFPAILHVIEAFIQAVPNIGKVTFCGGSNRDGALMMLMDKAVRESNPLEVLANISDAEKPIYDAALGILRRSVPEDVPLSEIATILTPGVGYLFLKQLWSRRGYGADTNAAYALHDAVQRDSDCPGLTHVARAALGVTLCLCAKGKLTAPDYAVLTGLEGVLRRQHPQAAFWARYLAAMARVLAEVVPCLPSSAQDLVQAIKFEGTFVTKDETKNVSLDLGISHKYERGLNFEDIGASVKDSFKKNKEAGAPKKVFTQVYHLP